MNRYERIEFLFNAVVAGFAIYGVTTIMCQEPRHQLPAVVSPEQSHCEPICDLRWPPDSIAFRYECN
jgi:hypothetical protein